MPGMIVRRLGDDATQYPESLNYVQRKIADFQRMGTIELPALRQQATTIWLNASAAGDADLANRAHAEFTKITQAQADWELNNDRLQSVLGPLRAVGVSLGALPAAWVVAVVIALALAMAALFITRDQSRTVIAKLCSEAIGKGQMTTAQCGTLLDKTTPPPMFGFGAVAAVAALGIGAYLYVNRKRSA
jgi:hypothetical protein